MKKDDYSQSEKNFTGKYKENNFNNEHNQDQNIKETSLLDTLNSIDKLILLEWEEGTLPESILHEIKEKKKEYEEKLNKEINKAESTEHTTARGEYQKRAHNLKRRIAKYSIAALLGTGIIIGGGTILIDPIRAEYYTNRGVAKEKLGKLEEAIQDYNKAIQLNPNNASAYFGRGIAKDDLGKFEEAIQDYNKAIQLDPDHVNAYLGRGNAKKNLGKLEEAIQDYTTAIRLDSNWYGSYLNRALANEQMNNNNSAMNDYEQALKLFPENERIKELLKKLKAHMKKEKEDQERKEKEYQERKEKEKKEEKEQKENISINTYRVQDDNLYFCIRFTMENEILPSGLKRYLKYSLENGRSVFLTGIRINLFAGEAISVTPLVKEKYSDSPTPIPLLQRLQMSSGRIPIHGINNSFELKSKKTIEGCGGIGGGEGYKIIRESNNFPYVISKYSNEASVKISTLECELSETFLTGRRISCKIKP